MTDRTGNGRRPCSRGGVAWIALTLVLVGCTGSGDQLRRPVPGRESEGPPAVEIFCERPMKQLPSCTPLPQPRRNLGSLGFAPERADPSRPGAGELVMRFGSWNMNSRNVNSRNRVLFDCSACFWQVYADGRFISRSGGPPVTFDGIVPAYLDQRLTPEGIELLREEILSSPMVRPGPGRGRWTSYAWFSADAFDGDRADSVSWSNGGSFTKLQEFYARMSQPGSWLPASAWADARIRAFVPSRYFVYGGDGPIHPRALPPPADSLLRPRGCQLVSREEARDLVTVFEDGLAPTGVGPPDPTSLEYRYQRNRGVGYLSLAPALPHETSCR